MKIHHYHPQTLEFVGTSTADADPMEPGKFLIPANATNTEPPAEVAGSVRVYVAGGWEYRTIEQPQTEPEPYVPSRAEIIRARLAGIDQESIRPARAIAMALAAGSAAPSFDTAKLQALETEAQALRQELAGLQ